MFPTSSLKGSAQIPSDAEFWMPKPEDIDEEGISFFRGTWLIKDIPVRAARRLAREERNVAEVVGNLAATPQDFDRLAHAAEDGYEGYVLTAEERAALDSFVSNDEGAALDSLELGVAGLVYALATVSHHSRCELPRACGALRLVGQASCPVRDDGVPR
jgi:hypothetical protein